MRNSLILVLLGITLWSLGLSSRSLMRPDEGRYAEIAREMAVNHDWVSPRLNAILYFEKPPLQYWMTASAIEVLGPTNLSARLWTALCGFLGIILVAWTGRRLWGALAGLTAAAVLSGSLYYVALGHINTLDMGVTFFITLSLCGFLIGLHENQRRYIWLAWLAAGLGFLSKGLIALVLPGASLILTSLVTQRWQVWKKLQYVPGFILLLIVTLPWLIAIEHAHPNFLQFFFIHEHLDRFTTTIHRRVEPIWYFIPLLFMGFLPWSSILIQSLYNPFREGMRRLFPSERFLSVFVIFVMVFFSLSDSKLPAYILPAFPALALLCGRYLSLLPHLPKKIKITTFLWGGALIFIGVMLTYPNLANQLHIHPDLDPDMLLPYQKLGQTLTYAGGLWIIAVIIVWIMRSLKDQIIVMALAGLLSTQVILMGSNALSPVSSMENIALKLKPQLQRASHIYSIDTYDQTLDYYLQRTVTLVHFQDELEMGLKLEPQQAISTIEQFTKLWDKDPNAYAIMEPSLYQKLKNQALPMRPVYEDFRHVIVART